MRRELASAFASGGTVVPLLVDGAELPQASAFTTPHAQEIAALAERQSLPLRRTEFDRDVEQILTILEQNGFRRKLRPTPGGPAPAPAAARPPAPRPVAKIAAIASIVTAIAVLLAVLLLDRRIVVRGQGSNGFALSQGQSIDVYVQVGDRARALLCSRPHAANAPEERLYPFAPLPPAPDIEVWERLGTVTFTATHAGRALTLIAITDCVTGAAVDPRSWLRTGQPVRVVFSDGSDQTSSVEVALE